MAAGGTTVDQATDVSPAAGELARIADGWLERGLDTTPADRPAAEAAVRRAYAEAGLPAPERIVWLGSPRAGALAAALLTGAAPAGDPAPVDGRADDDPVATVRAALVGQGCPVGPEVAGRSVRARVRTTPWATARAAAVERLDSAGWPAHWAAGAQRAWQLLVDRIVTPLRSRLTEDLPALTPADPGFGRRAAGTLLDAVFGQHDAAWLAALDGDARLAGLAGVARAAGWWWPYERVAILTERPVRVERDNVGRLHHGDGPALVYPDGFGLHAWRGMPIPAEVAAELPRLTVERIGAESNAEVRRVMLEHFGYDRYLRQTGARSVHRDETGVLWRLDLPDDEPLLMVEVVNSTPEPDGTSRVYWLRVPPETATARGGVAWTFGLTEEEYQPLAQT